MTQEQAQELFINALEATPGVVKIMKVEENKPHRDVKFFCNKIDDGWHFIATIQVLKSTNCRAIVRSIGEILNFNLVKKNEKIGKLNIFIGGITNDQN
ncbi:hypothetical protein [Mycoplasmopsis opalescens]|uniref:hypothetical protein n=1 Tax=Mycoplasmopsis opalescens TaxID=114886 RepID=UPI0004A748A8|nr:hypothetical protein [Mycoplasmopsis opalescens]